MRTIEKTVYTLNELTEDVKNDAYENWKYPEDYCNDTENAETLKAFANIFPVQIKNYEYGYRNYINFIFTMDEEIDSLHGERLATYILNNYKRFIYKGKYYLKNKYVDGKFINKFRYSKIFFEESCVLTGYCVDDDIMKPIYNFLKNPSENINFYDLMDDCLNSWLIACKNDYEYCNSFEYFCKISEANEWEYDEDGNMI